MQDEGGKGGSALSWETEADAGMWSRTQGRAAEAGGWWVRATSRWVELFTNIGGGERANNKRDLAMNGYVWGDSRKEGETNNPENYRIKKGGAVGLV